MSKVCMVVHQDYYIDGRVRRYAEALADAGVMVDVLCVPSREEDQPSGTGASDAEPPINNIRVFTIALHRGYKRRANYLLEYLIAVLLYSIRLLALQLRNHYDLIHVHNMPDFLVFAALIPRLLGAKVILDIHDPMPEFYRSKYCADEQSMMVRMLKWQERLCARVAHAIIAANANFRAHLIQRGIPAAKITVINNVADQAIFRRAAGTRQPKSLEQPFTLLYPGTMAPRYSLETALHALILLIPKIPEIQLVLMGPTVDYAHTLRQLATDLGVAEHVLFHPAVPIHEVPRQMAQADIGIYTAQPDPHMSIATPTKVLEYAAMGIPIVASRLPIVESYFGDDDILFFEPGNVQAFADAIEALHANPLLRENLVRNVDRHFLSTHTWARECQRYFVLLNRLLPRQKGLGSAVVTTRAGTEAQ